MISFIKNSLLMNSINEMKENLKVILKNAYL